jgi:hypothetical protein
MKNPPIFAVAPTSMPGHSLFQWQDGKGPSGLHSLQMPTEIAEHLAGLAAEDARSREKGGCYDPESVHLAHIEELRRQNAALLEQVAELSAIVREIPARLTSARLDGREGVPTVYDYARAERALRVRV